MDTLTILRSLVYAHLSQNFIWEYAQVLWSQYEICQHQITKSTNVNNYKQAYKIIVCLQATQREGTIPSKYGAKTRPERIVSLALYRFKIYQTIPPVM